VFIRIRITEGLPASPAAESEMFFAIAQADEVKPAIFTSHAFASEVKQKRHPPMRMKMFFMP